MRRLASTIRTTTSKTCSMTTRSNIYIGRKGNADINQENEKKVKELYGTDLRTKPKARSQKGREKKVRSGYERVIKLGNSLREKGIVYGESWKTCKATEIQRLELVV